MKFNMKFRAAALAVTLAWSTGGAFAQIPVTDVASLTQQIQQVMAWGQQFQQMKESLEKFQTQIDNQVKQIQAITGGRGMSSLASNMTRQQLPDDFVQAFDQLRSSGEAGASSGAKGIYAAIKSYGCSDKYTNNDAGRLACEAMAMAIPSSIDTVNKSISSAKSRQDQLKQFLSSIDTNDEKAALDLSNRIQTEIAFLQNEKLMMDIALQQQQMQLRLTEQQIAEKGAKRLTRSSGAGSNPFNLQ